MTAILFDVDDTLYDQSLPFRCAYDRLFGGALDIPVEPLFIASRRHGDEVFMKSQNNEISMEEMYRYRLQKAFEDFHAVITDGQAMEFQRVYQQAQKQICLSGTMERVLDLCMERGAAMGVVTNGPSGHQWGKVGALGLTRWMPKEHVIVSGDVGYAKPDERIFGCAEERMALDKGDTYYVGDSFENDMKGAGRVGWRTVWMNRRGHGLDEDEGIRPDVCVEDEEQLFQAIRRILGG